jgi:hypothetical protein
MLLFSVFFGRILDPLYSKMGAENTSSRAAETSFTHAQMLVPLYANVAAPSAWPSVCGPLFLHLHVFNAA